MTNSRRILLPHHQARPYQPRTPHVHVAVYKNGHRMLTTQCYINGHPLNEDDVVLKGLSDPSLKKLLMV